MTHRNIAPNQSQCNWCDRLREDPGILLCRTCRRGIVRGELLLQGRK